MNNFNLHNPEPSQNSSLASCYDVTSTNRCEDDDLVRELLSARRLIESSPENLNLCLSRNMKRENVGKKGVTSRGSTPLMQSYSEGDFRLVDALCGDTLRKVSKHRLEESFPSSVWSVSTPHSNLSGLPVTNMQKSNFSLWKNDVQNAADQVEYSQCVGDEPKSPLFPGNEPQEPNESVKECQGLPITVQQFKSRPSRDPENINYDLKIDFSDVIAEPEGFDTPKYSWHVSKELYGFGKSCCYTVVSFIFGIPVAFFWGLWFAMLSCATVWCLIPIRRSHVIHMSYIGACWRDVIKAFCDPFCLSCSRMFQRVHVATEKHIV